MAAGVSHTLLIVDDEPDVVAALRRVLRSPRYEIVGCTSPLDALEILAARPVDLVISDLDMPGMHGLDLLRRVRRDHPDTVRVVLTGRASLDSALEAINQGEVQRYLTKPWEQVALRRTVGECLERLAEVRSSADAARKVSRRAQILEALEERYPGMTRVAFDDGAVRLDAERLDGRWTLRDALGASTSDTWLLDPADAGDAVALPDDLEGLAGVVVDRRFRLDEPIGSGGFGVVYRAVQLSLDRFVAIKLLRTRARDPGEHLERFRVEALSSCRVVHPNAVTVLDAGVDDQGLAYLVMELLTGETVAQRLISSDTLTFDVAAAMAADLCAALAVAHASGILHRDIKPANVFLHEGAEGSVTKLLDFGIAKLVSPESALPHLTAEHALVGTAAYIAPERAMRRPADGRADVYSVGVLLYEALSGVKPLAGPSVAEMLRQHVTVKARPLIAVDPTVPAALSAIVDRMLCKDPTDRPTASEACSLLRDLAPQLPRARMIRLAAPTTSATTEM